MTKNTRRYPQQQKFQKFQRPYKTETPEKKNVYTLSIMKILAQMDEKFDPKHSKLIVCNENLKNENLGKKIYCEIFVMDPKMHKDKRCIGLIDSGADLSIIQQSYLKRLQREDKDNTFDTSSYQLTSYSNNTIKILRGGRQFSAFA